jgi:hypothetical protein
MVWQLLLLILALVLGYITIVFLEILKGIKQAKYHKKA